MSHQLYWLPSPPTFIQSKVPFLVVKSQLGFAPKYLCDHIRSPVSASSLRVSALPNAMIFSCLGLGQPCPHQVLCFYWSVNLESPPSAFSLVYSLWSSSLSRLKTYLVLELI